MRRGHRDREVLGYRLDARHDDRTLDVVFARAANALQPGGMLLFDLAGPNRVPRTGQRVWKEGADWAVLVEATTGRAELRRRIVAFREVGAGCLQRSEEVRHLWLHSPFEALVRLRSAGFAARRLARGYAGERLPCGLPAYLARKR